MAERDLPSRLRRAVKENNLFLVKRLVQRTGIRNPDPDHKRYTSLAWAAALGHEETFEFLLSAGHEDEEGPSKDDEDGTILNILAETRGASGSGAYRLWAAGVDPGAALRMARLYVDRYPDTINWANDEGKTPLHVASLKGNEELVQMLLEMSADPDLTDNEGNTPLHYASAWGHIPIVQLLIERGCSYTVKNNEGFSASDYAYSFSTRDTLQDTARSQYETMKNNRSRMKVIQQKQQLAHRPSRDRLSPTPPPVPPKNGSSHEQAARLRSGSAASYSTTATSDSSEHPDAHLRHKPSYSSMSTTGSSPSQLSAPNGIFRPRAASSRGSSSASTLHSPAPSAAPALHTHAGGSSSALSPVASRVRAQDADAMEKWMKMRPRTQSGSADLSADAHARAAHANGSMPPPPVPLPRMPVSAGPSANGDDLGALAALNISGSVAPRRRLRPSQSASQLHAAEPPLPPPPLNTAFGREPPGARARAGTGPDGAAHAGDATPQATTRTRTLTPPSDRVLFSSPTQAVPPPRPSPTGARNEYAGPPSQYAQFDGPREREPERQSSVDKTPTQANGRRMPFKLSKNNGGSFDGRSTPIPTARGTAL